MGLKNNYQKFKKHLESGGLFYVFSKGIKYLVFLMKKQRDRFKKVPKKTENAIFKGKIKIVYSEKRLNLFWDNAEITKGAGLNIAINTLGLWTNSTEANWQVLEKEQDRFKFKIVFQNLPLSQIWNIQIINEKEIGWQVETEIEEWLHIDEFRIVCLVNLLYKTWVNQYQQADFPRPDNNWQELCLENSPTSLVGIRFPVEGKFLPSLTLEAKDSLFPLIQNPPLNNHAHIIGFRHINPQEREDYSPGQYHLFSGRINLFIDDSQLDTKIENLRQTSLNNVMRRKLKERKLKILLVNLPWQREGKWGVRAGSRWPHIKDESEGDYLPFPFFLAYSTSLLHKHNIHASIIDAIAEKTPEDKFLERVSGMNFDYLVAETSIPSFYDDLKLLKKIHKIGIPIILCGPNTEIYNPQFLRETSFIDFILYGEYEFTLLNLVKSLQESRDLSKINGLIYKDATIIKNPRRELFDVNLLPWPYREDGLPIYKYLDAPGEMLTPSVQIMASRGCPFKCQFCLWPQVIYQGNHYRTRNLKDIIDEMEYLVKEKGFKSVYFDDDTFNIGKERMLLFCNEIRERRLDKIQWAIMARPDLMDKEILENMKEAGLWAVKYGVESATQRLVDNINKNIDLRKTENIVRLTKELGIKAHLAFTFGLPGETEETIEKTIKWAQELDAFSVQFSITTPFPGTKYYEILEKENLIISKDFSHYDGHSKSVIKLENLTARDLELAKQKAYRIWAEHLRKKRGFWGEVERFYHYLKNKGLTYALNKTISYCKYIWLEKNKYLNLKDITKNTNSLNRNKVLLETCGKNSNYLGVDILLIQCPPWDITMPPLGIAYLSSYLRKHGYRTSIFDLNIALHNAAKDDLKFLWEQKSHGWWTERGSFNKIWVQLEKNLVSCLENNLKDADAKFIGLSVNATGINFVAELLRILYKHKKNEARIILGGWGCTTAEMRSHYPKELVDIFVIGEGEESLREIIEVSNSQKNITEIPGAIFVKNGRSIYKPRSPIKDLENIPWPTFNEFNLSQYKFNFILPLLTSRGCIGNCSFCNDCVLSRPYRFRSSNSIFEEIRYHLENNHITNFALKDLLCNGNMHTLHSLSESIISSGIKISWDSQAIPRKEMTYEFLCKLKKSGCRALIYGIEAFSNNVLKGMRKIFTKEIAEKVLEDTYRAGIDILINIIVGFPGETEEDFNETLEGIKRNRRYISRLGAVSVCLVNNDCDLEANFQKYKLILPDDPRIRAKKWCSLDGKNNYQIRRERADRVIKLLNEVGLTYETTTI